MAIIKMVAFWVIWVAQLVIKIPITLASALFQWIEVIYTRMLGRLVVWSKNEWVIDTYNACVELNACAYEDVGSYYLDMEIES